MDFALIPSCVDINGLYIVLIYVLLPDCISRYKCCWFVSEIVIKNATGLCI